MQTYSEQIDNLMTRLVRKMEYKPGFREMMYGEYGSSRAVEGEPQPSAQDRIERVREVLLDLWEGQSDEEILASYEHMASDEVRPEAIIQFEIDPTPSSRYFRNLARRGAADKVDAFNYFLKHPDCFPEPLTPEQYKMLYAVHKVWFTMRTCSNFNLMQVCKLAIRVQRHTFGYPGAISMLLDNRHICRLLGMEKTVDAERDTLTKYVEWQHPKFTVKRVISDNNQQ
jgi:hypothetical protein